MKAIQLVQAFFNYRPELMKLCRISVQLPPGLFLYGDFFFSPGGYAPPAQPEGMADIRDHGLLAGFIAVQFQTELRQSRRLQLIINHI